MLSSILHKTGGVRSAVVVVQPPSPARGGGARWPIHGGDVGGYCRKGVAMCENTPGYRCSHRMSNIH